MNRNEKESLIYLLDRYYKSETKICECNCRDCSIGVLFNYDDRYYCPIEIVKNAIEHSLEC